MNATKFFSKAHLSLLVLLLFSAGSFAQQGFGIQWQRILSGSRLDMGNSLSRTSDGGFILGASTSSIDGEFFSTNPVDQYDIVIMKFTSYGALQWKKRYGGSKSEKLGNIIPTNDEGFVFCATTSSSDGDIDDAQPNTINTWVVKLDNQGTIQWKKCISRVDLEYDPIVSKLNDGSLIVTGLVDSGPPVPGDDPATSIGLRSKNIKVVKLNASNGAVLWEKYFGGNGYEILVEAKSGSANNTGILIQSNSTTGDFPIPRADSSISRYYYYLFEIDSAGTAKWIKKLNLMQGQPPLVDFMYSVTGGMYLVQTKPPVDFPNNTNQSVELLRVSASGDTLWRKNIGNGFYSNNLLDNKFHIVYDEQKKNIFFSMFRLDLAPNNNISSQQVISIDTTGNVIWEKKFIFPWYYYPGTVYNDFISYADGFLLTGLLRLENYVYDLILTKIGRVNLIKGIAVFDTNGNGIKDSSENGFNYGIVNTEKLGVTTAQVPVNGHFEIFTDTGTFKTTFQPYKPYYLVSPESWNSVFSTYYNKDSINFFIKPIAGKRDISVVALPLGFARPGFVERFNILYKNEGTDTITSGSVRFLKDRRTKFVNAIPAPDQTIADTIIWNYTNLKPFDIHSIDLRLELGTPPTLVNNDVLSHIATITPSNDLTPADDSSFVNQVVTGSFDPNDKKENFGGKMPLKKLIKGDYIYYLIRFQNTGNDTAFTVRITDTLENKLQWESFEMIGSSHPCEVTIRDKNKIEWIFNNIQLPDSGRNKLASEGYVAFKIKGKNTLAVGETIQNKAYIYFDFNLPVITNNVVTTISTDVVTALNNFNNEILRLQVSPNPANGQFHVIIKGSLSGQFSLSITDINGYVVSHKLINRFSTLDQTILITDSKTMPAGIYFITLRKKGKVWTKKLIVQ